jgi:hypothetical protein
MAVASCPARQDQASPRTAKVESPPQHDNWNFAFYIEILPIIFRTHHCSMIAARSGIVPSSLLTKEMCTKPGMVHGPDAVS